MKWIVDYRVGTKVVTYKNKIVEAETAEQAIRKAKCKNIVDLNEVKED